MGRSYTQRAPAPSRVPLSLKKLTGPKRGLPGIIGPWGLEKPDRLPRQPRATAPVCSREQIGTGLGCLLEVNDGLFDRLPPENRFLR